MGVRGRGSERPVPVGPGGEVEGIVAVEVDVPAGQRRDVLDLAAGDQLAGAAQVIESVLGVDGVPGDDRVDDDREAERLLALLLGGALSDVAFVGVEDRPSKGMELLAFVELPSGPIRPRSSWSASQARIKFVLTSRPYS